MEGDASAFHEVVTDIKQTFEGEDVSQEQLDQILKRVMELEQKVQALGPKEPGNYPVERDCNRGCGKKVWVQYSRNKQKEYQTNSEDYKNFHNCGEQIPF